MTITLKTLAENTAGAIGLQAEWGWSIMVETAEKRILVDTGSDSVAIHNADVMGVNLKNIDAILISHAHADHSGGLRNVLKRTGRKEIIAHPGIWAAKHKTDLSGNNPYYNGIPFAKAELEKLADFNLQEKPVEIASGVLTTGEVPMVTEFETPEPNFWIKTNDGLEPDDFPDDQALILTHPNGLIVVLGCAHRGIVNTLLHARNITGIERIQAVVGGTHLYPKNEEQIKKTVSALKELHVQKIGVSHCTGFSAAHVLAEVFGSGFFLNSTGTVTAFY